MEVVDDMSSVPSLESIGEKVFGEKYKMILDWSVKREKPDMFHAIPKGKVANVFIVIEAVGRLLIRHESDTEEVTTIPTYAGYSVPAILNTKFQSGAVRRQMLSMLHEWFNREGNKYINVLKQYGYSKDTYTCVMRPFQREKREGGKVPEYFEGYCGECPNCLIFGYAVQEGAGYNVKSRVEGDIYVAPVPEEKATVSVTFNAVDDIKKTTIISGEEGSRTGALYTLRLVEVGTSFVGKMALKDMTFAELLLTLLAIARTTRIGGRVTHFGEIRVHIPAIVFSRYEVGSGYEIANMILGKTNGERITVEKIIERISEYVKGFQNSDILVVDRSLADKLRSLSREEESTIILQAWKDVLVYKKSLDLFTKERQEKSKSKKEETK
jgi:CRISPR-associated protein Csc2